MRVNVEGVPGRRKNRRGRSCGVLREKWNGAERVQGKSVRAQGGGNFRTWDIRDVRGLGKTKGISIATLNIRLGRAGGMEAALLVTRQGKVDVGLLQETNLMDRIHA